MHHHPEKRKIKILTGTFLLLLLSLLTLKSSYHRPSERTTLLSFDVEPVDGEDSVIQVIELLRSENVNATFFVTGEYAEKYPEIIKKMEGFEVACHGWSHKPFTRMNSSEKKSELAGCREMLEQLTGEKIIGFRAPYNRIDRSTLAILEDGGFTYDASMIMGLGFLFPDVDERKIGEVPISSISGIPLEDVVWLYYLHLDCAYFYILKHKSTPFESYLFHPHHIAGHKAQLKEFIRYLKDENVTFISHSGLILSHEGV
jgi:peptidoglycan/xylan/chitin deacetylase (PgdA/CDA1 family)